MLTISVCHKKCFCVDCNDEKCLHAGKAEADCPRYHCVYDSNSAEFLDCEKCLWLKGYKEDLKEGGKNG